MKKILILMMVLGSVSLYAQTNRSGNPVNPTQPDPNKPNTAVTPNANVPVIPQSQTIQPGNSQATITPGGQLEPLLKNDTKPSIINANANTNQHVTTPGNTKIDNTDIDHTPPSGTQRVDGTTATPPKK
jgi:hypothetical protein